MAKAALPPDDLFTLGDLLKFLRKRAGLSLRELSIAVGYSESHLSRIERNERSLDRTTLLARIVPELYLQDEPEVVARLLVLCATASENQGAGSLSVVTPAPHILPAVHGYLPASLTSFVGRIEEGAEVTMLLGDPHHRLVTLTGAGGCGKTRLALQVGQQIAQDYLDGIWWVELAALTEPQRLVSSVAAALGVKDDADDTLFALLGVRLRPCRALLILDNCEHLVEAVARLAAGLLGAAPHLQILATSREALGIPGEWVYPVQTLALPPAQR